MHKVIEGDLVNLLKKLHRKNLTSLSWIFSEIYEIIQIILKIM